MSRARARAAAIAVAAGLVIVLGALVIGLTARTGTFTFGTAALVTIYLLWPVLLLVVAILLAASFVLFAAAFFQRVGRGGIPGRPER
jgi:hypothetical protein